MGISTMRYVFGESSDYSVLLGYAGMVSSVSLPGIPPQAPLRLIGLQENARKNVLRMPTK